ncbi:response regulator [Aliikangiella sp. IMCC44632]
MTNKQSKKIVVVEDQKLLNMLLVELIEDFGHQAISFNNGQEALDFLRGNSADLLMTDLFMPEMGGSELIEALFKDNILIPVVIVSGVEKDEIYSELSQPALEEFYKTNIQFIQKPLNEFNIRLLRHFLDTL